MELVRKAKKAVAEVAKTSDVLYGNFLKVTEDKENRKPVRTRYNRILIRDHLAKLRFVRSKLISLCPLLSLLPARSRSKLFKVWRRIDEMLQHYRAVRAMYRRL